jgi:predicted XRE-type DNA-binding protein
MKKLEVGRGSGSVFQFKAILAAEIIKALDRDHLTVRAAHRRTGIAAAEFSRIRNADLGRFTVDRLMSIINRLGSRVEVRVRVNRAETVAQEARREGAAPRQRHYLVRALAASPHRSR